MGEPIGDGPLFGVVDVGGTKIVAGVATESAILDTTRIATDVIDGADAVTDQGLDRLLTALPNVHFHRDQQHRPGDPNADKHAPSIGDRRPPETQTPPVGETK